MTGSGRGPPRGLNAGVARRRGLRRLSQATNHRSRMPASRARQPIRPAFRVTPLDAVEGKTITGVDRLGKRIVLSTTDDLFVIIHLMVAGRLRWRATGFKIPKKLGLAAFDFPNGMLLLTEAGSTRRASIHVVEGRSQLREHDPGGLDVMNADLNAFRDRSPVGKSHAQASTNRSSRVSATPTLTKSCTRHSSHRSRLPRNCSASRSCDSSRRPAGR